MNPFLMLFASGLSLYCGGALLILAVLVRMLWPKRFRIVTNIIVFLALTLIVLSGTPIDRPRLIVAILVIVFWLIMTHLPADRIIRIQKIAHIIVLMMTVTFLAAEAYWWRTPRLAAAPDQVYIVGDSLTAGIGDVRWPDLLEKQRRIIVNNYAVAGATLRTALPQVQRIPKNNDWVLLEIGGNDLLDGQNPDLFYRDLDQLISQLSGHPVVMFELPLYPWDAGIGNAQRKLALKYNIPLIPKHRMSFVFLGKATTVDGLHLSNLGAQRMANIVADVFALPVR